MQCPSGTEGGGAERKKKKKPFSLSHELTTSAQIRSFKFSTKIPRQRGKQKTFIKGCRVYLPSYLPLPVIRDVFTHETI